MTLTNRVDYLSGIVQSNERGVIVYILLLLERMWRNGSALMQTREKGNLTEAKILAALVAAGYLVSVPFGEGHKYDFIIDDSTNIGRVQCKTGRVKNGVLIFNSYSQYGQVQKINRAVDYLLTSLNHAS